MRLSNQAVGALMMALQRSLMEQTDIVPILQEMNLQINPEDSSQSELVVTNPPTINFDTVELNEEG
jgi:hypothetical protein|tara:strand:- start:3618 stop:3815 length:198 start_codon:yes stop_codon:yes gene_type:complete